MMQKNYHVIDTLVLQTIQSDVIWLSTNNYYFFCVASNMSKNFRRFEDYDLIFADQCPVGLRC
jgi:hypothetical protein